MNPTRYNGEVTAAEYTKSHRADKGSRQRWPEEISPMPIPPPPHFPQGILRHRAREQGEVQNLPQPPPTGC